MANAERGEADLVVGAKTYVVKLDTEAVVCAETALDKPMPTIVDGMRQGRLGYIVIILWAALQAHHKPISARDASAIIDEVGLPTVVEALKLAFKRSTVNGGEKEPAEGNVPAAA